MSMDRKEQKFLGKTLFTWESWDEVDVAYLYFYNVEFQFESMKKYNGCDVSLDIEGSMEIYDGNNKVVWTGFPTDIEDWDN